MTSERIPKDAAHVFWTTAMKSFNAKAPLAVIVAIVILQVAWFSLSSSLFVLMNAGGSAANLHENHLLAMWIVGACFGGFCATFVAIRLFRTVKPSTITTGFSLVIFALLTLGAVPTLFQPSYEPLFY